jgi:hypothetical protein
MPLKTASFDTLAHSFPVSPFVVALTKNTGVSSGSVSDYPTNQASEQQACLIDGSHSAAARFAENFEFAEAFQRESARRIGSSLCLCMHRPERPVAAASAKNCGPRAHPSDSSPSIMGAVPGCEQGRWLTFSQA